MRWVGLSVAVAVLLAGCAGRQRALPVAGSEPPESASAGPEVSGYSGLVHIEGNRYLVVHDTKSQHDRTRLGVIEVSAGAGVAYRPLVVGGWPEPWGRSNDMEGACAHPGRSNEFLAVEASFWKGRPRRLLHFRLVGEAVEVLAATELPPGGDGAEADGRVYYEGLACAQDGEGVLVVIGQYGGETSPRTARLRWGRYASGRLDFTPAGLLGVAVAVPGRWATDRPRGLTDLYLDQNILWAAAAEDPGDEGPFRSLVYRVATVDVAAEVPVTVDPAPWIGWVLDGFKIEALAAPAAATPGSPLSFGTEDEAYGGVWRPLAPALEGQDGQD